MDNFLIDKITLVSVGVSVLVVVGGVVLLRVYRNKYDGVGLLEAAQKGNVNVIRNTSGDVDKLRDEQQYTALSLAVRYGKLDCVQVLLSKRASVEVMDKFGFTPLHTAAHYNAPPAIVRCLLENRSNIEAIAFNSWTPLHMAAAAGHLELVKILIAYKANLDTTSVASQTPLLMASCNSHKDVVQVLLESGADSTIRTIQKLESPLYYATATGQRDIVELLITKNPSLMTVGTSDGALPIHVATAKKDLGMIKYLIQKGADIKARKKDGTSVLHIVATQGDDLLEELLQLGAPLEGQDSFGSTPLHKATTKKQVNATALLIKNGALVNCVDNDKMTPLHTLCSSPTDKIMGPLVDNALKIFELLCDNGADLKCRDRSNSTPLHHAVCRPWNLPLVKRIIEKDPSTMFLSDVTERTPLHLVTQMYQYTDIIQYLEEQMMKVDKSFFNSYDPKHRMQSTFLASHTEEASYKKIEKLFEGDTSLDGIAKLISKGTIKNIIVLTGAGISTNAGIPDFRSPDKGLYTNPSLTLPKDAFTLYSFHSEPEFFFSAIQQLFLPVMKGLYKPTLAHRFIALLDQKGLLVRNYSQNIDTLEERAGVRKEKIVNAHGSFNSATCPNCRFNVKTDTLDCIFWKKIENGEIPYCERCESQRGEKIALKPDIVLFGEPLPAIFFDNQKEDFEKCDLVIVMGTSLTVYPFAGLPNQVKSDVPRLLFNVSAVGPFVKGVQQKFDNEGKLVTIQKGNNRDIAVISDIDKAVQALLDKLEWSFPQ